MISVYADRNNRDSKGVIPLDTFIDKVYFDVKELYEEAEEKKERRKREETAGVVLLQRPNYKR